MPISILFDASTLDVLELNEALDALALNSSRAAEVVELKFFGGLSREEIAVQVGVSVRTVNSDWQYAKAWLYRQMAGE
ncbi:RNA polymerase sigma factor [Thalassoglobus neptunius]|uniref:RNA polymerase sigma factor n=1 Tax=Thalassoglobus neptunius TaxID=1938619 RepID=A0A5C5VSB3_9PLAN|nr:ECF-type sigma factor [Thalassoglobus neptunius]TWT41504.1 RNA polymerase sigma factor [Thalassoglobus neptunius]